MDDGSRVGQGIKFSTNSFSYQDCIKLSEMLFNLFKIKTSVQSAGVPNQYVIYVFKQSIPLLRDIVKPYIVSSILYKIQSLINNKLIL